LSTPLPMRESRIFTWLANCGKVHGYMRSSKWFFLFLVMFCVAAGAVDFFHQETGFVTDYDCPACLFQSTFFAALRFLVVLILFVLTLVIVILEHSLPRLCRGKSLPINNKSPPLPGFGLSA